MVALIERFGAKEVGLEMNSIDPPSSTIFLNIKVKRKLLCKVI